MEFLSSVGQRRRLPYFALVPAIVVAVLALGAMALRTTLQIEKARQQTVFDATMTLADERVDRLDKLIIAQDNVVAAHVDVANLSAIARRWLPTAARETPTVRAILVLDMEHEAHDVLAFASRGAPGREDDAFRRLLLVRLMPQMNFGGDTTELRHLHHVIDQQSLLVSYWQRSHQDRRYLVVAWHDVPRLVHEAMPRLYRDLDRDKSRMNVIDEEGRIVFGPPIKGGEFTVGRPFPTTLYNWRLQMALTTAEELGQKLERQRLLELLMVSVAAAVALAGLAIVVVASVKERRLAALKSDFVANVSHELKTPLSLVRMFGELLLGDRVPNDEKRRQYLQIIVSESERLTALIENVLDFAKVERGKAAYEFAPGSIVEVVTRAIDLYQYRAEREQVAVELKIAEGLPDALIDARALELALVNLLDNALKYAKDGGLVEVVVEAEGGGRGTFFSSQSGPADRVVIRVTDRGPGIDPDEQRHIFERFVRGRRASEQRLRGSGIGLALVKHIAESHGGSVRVESPVTEDGRGSSFIVSIPALAQGAAPERDAHGGEARPDPAHGAPAEAQADGEGSSPAVEGSASADARRPHEAEPIPPGAAPRPEVS